MTTQLQQDEGLMLQHALAPVQPLLAQVTERLLTQLTDPVARNAVYLITAGGKRLRPALVLLAGAAGGTAGQPALIDAATAVELIHTATLIHDDIIDQSPLRRSQPTFHARWGTERAVLMGDYLYATAFTLLARLESPRVMQLMADVCQELCRGELREVEARFRLDLSEVEYLQIIQDKTASLISGCCRAGAILGGCRADVVDRLAQFGTCFGLAFQIIDDCLDLIGDQERLGKSILTDLDKGVLSLPIIYLTQQLSARERDELFAPLRLPAAPHGDGWNAAQAEERAMDPAFLAQVAAAASASGAITKAQDKAAQLIREAEAAVDDVELNGLAETFRLIARQTTLRRS